MSILYIVPTRGRPDNAFRLAQAFQSTVQLPDTELLFAIDADDDTRFEYTDTLSKLRHPASQIRVDARFTRTALGPNLGGMNSVLNRHATAMAPHYDYVGFMGDDHVPRTPGWDAQLTRVIEHAYAAIIYGDDLVQRVNLPTAVLMTSNIIKTLGYMAPPELAHMYLDNFWRDLGRTTGILRYEPSVVIEHLHPVHPDAARRPTWDTTYDRGNGKFGVDEIAYQLYIRTRFADDVQKITQLREDARA